MKRSRSPSPEIDVYEDLDGEFLNSGAIVPGQSLATVHELKRRRLHEGFTRPDGYPGRINDNNGPYGLRKFMEMLDIERILDRDPNMTFVRLVAGFTNEPVTEFYNKNSVERSVLTAMETAQQRRAEFANSSKFVELSEKRVRQLREERDANRAKLSRLNLLQSEHTAGVKRLNAALAKGIEEMEPLKSLTKIDIANDTTQNTFDVLTRGAVLHSGTGGYSSDTFRVELTTAVQIVCSNIAQDAKEPELKTFFESESPTTADVALLLAFLFALGEESELQTMLASTPQFQSTSRYHKEPRLYVEHLLQLRQLLFFSNNPNYLHYKHITIGTYVKLVEMHEAADLGTERPARVFVKPDATNEISQETINVLNDLDYTVLLRPRVAGEADGVYLSEEQRIAFKGYVAETRNAPAVYLRLLRSLIEPAYHALFGHIAYKQAPENELGGRRGSARPRTLYEVRDSPTQKKYNGEGATKDERAEALSVRAKRRSARTRTQISIFIPSALPNKHADSVAATATVNKSAFKTLPGMLILAVGIYSHSIASPNGGTDQSLAHLLADGIEHAAPINAQLNRLYEEVVDSETYRKMLRRYVQEKYLADAAAQAVLREEAARRELQLDQLRMEQQAYQQLKNAKTAAEKLKIIGESLLSLSDEEGQPTDKQKLLLEETTQLPVLVKVAEDQNQIQTELTNSIASARDSLKKKDKELDDALNILNDRLEQRNSNQNALGSNGPPNLQDWQIDPEFVYNTINTGVIRLSSIFVSAMTAADSLIDAHVQGMRGWSPEQRQTTPHIASLYASLVAAQIHGIQINFPDRYRNAAAAAHQKMSVVSILQRLRELTSARYYCSPPSMTSMQVRRGNIYGAYA